MTNPSDRFPDDKQQHVVAAFKDYLDAFKACAQSDGSDIVALLHQLVEAGAAMVRVMAIGPVLAQHIERVLGPPPAQPAARADPAVEAQCRDDLARWVMQAWQILLQDFLKPIMGDHPMLDALHNDADRGLAGNPLLFFRALAPKPRNTRDVLRHTAKDAAVYTVILAEAEAELDEKKDRIKQVLDRAGVGVTPRAFSKMRQHVEDRDAKARIEAEAKRRRHNHQIRKKAARQASRSSRGRPAAPRPEKSPATVLIVGSLTDAELMALYPDRYSDLAGRSADERIYHLFGIWHGTGG